MSYKANSNIIKVSTTGVVGANGLIVGNPDTTAKDASAALEIESTTGGLLLPRVTTVQRDAIVSPSQGLTVYNTDIQKVQTRTSTEWAPIAGSLIGVREFLSGSGTYTPTPGTRSIFVEVCGGGGGGGGATNPDTAQLYVGAPGSAAMSVFALITIANSSTTGSYSVGAGGTAGFSNTINGGNGGDTTFSITNASLTAAGGNGGQSAVSSGGQRSVASKFTGSTATGSNVLYSKIFNGDGGTATLREAIANSIFLYDSQLCHSRLCVLRYLTFSTSLSKAYSSSSSINLDGASAFLLGFAGSGGGPALLRDPATRTRSGGTGGSGAILIWEYA